MWSSTSTSTVSMSPTKPMSVSPPASLFLTVNSRPSSPHSPTAGCPWRLMPSTMSLFCLPTSTIFATSTVAFGDPQPVHEAHLHPEALHVARDGGAAVLDDHRLTVKLPDVRERLEERCDISHEV